MAEKKKGFLESVAEFSRNFGNAFSQPKQQPTITDNTVAAKAGSGLGRGLGSMWDLFIFNPKNLNQLGQNPLTQTVAQNMPKVDWSSKIQQDPNSVLDDVARFGVSIPEGIINSPANTVQGFQNFSANVGTPGYSAQQAAADLAKSADLPLQLATFGQLGFAKNAMAQSVKNNAGKSLLKRSLDVAKIGAKEGGITGSLYGLKGGLEANRDTQDPLEYITNVGKATGTGAVAGAVTAGTLSGLTYAGGSAFNKLLTDRRSVDFFRKGMKGQPEVGYTPEAIRESVRISKLADSDFGKVMLSAADEAEKLGKHIKFSEVSKGSNKGVRVGKRNYNRSIDFIDSPTSASAAVRPSHQAALEQALARNDAPAVKSILDSIPDDDPYKAQMEHLFRGMAEGDVAMKNVDTPVMRNEPVAEGVDRVVFRATDSNDGRSVLGKGTYVADAPSSVQRYGKKIERFVLDRNAKMLDLSDPASLTKFQDDAIAKYSDEYYKMLDKSDDVDNAIGEVMTKYAKDLGYDGIRADDVAFGTVVFNKDMLRPDTSTPPGVATIDDVQKQIDDLVAETDPAREVLENPELLARRLQEDPQSLLEQQAIKPEPPVGVPATKNAAIDEGAYGLSQIGKREKTSRGLFEKAKEMSRKAYDAMVDQYDAIFRDIRDAGGDETNMRLAMAGNYGANSKAKARLYQDMYPIWQDAEKTVGIDNFREYLIDMGNIERGSRGTFGYVDQVEPSRASLDALANKLGVEKMTQLENLAQRWYDYHRKGIQMAVDAGVLSPDHAQNIMDRNQFYMHFDRAIQSVDDFVESSVIPGSKSAGSISSQNVFKNVRGGTGKIRDPLQSAIVDTYMLQSAIERNNVATVATNELKKLGLADQVTFAENKVKRQSIFSDLKELKPIKGKLDRTLKTLMRTGKNLEKAKNDLAREGIKSVKREVSEENTILRRNEKLQGRLDQSMDKAQQALLQSEEMKPIIEALGGVKRYNKSIATRLMNEINDLNQKGIDAYTKKGVDVDGENLAKNLKLEQSVTGTLSEGKTLSSGQVRKLVKQLVEVSPEGINAIKRKIAKTEPQLAEAIDAFVNLSVSLKNVKDNKVFQDRSMESIIKGLMGVTRTNAQENIDILSRQATLPEMGGPISAKQARSLIEQLIDMDDYTLGRFKQRLGTLDEKTQKVLSDIDMYRTTLDQINQRRSALWDEAQLMRDASTRGKSVIYRLNNGIKEAWEVSPEVATALKGLNGQQLSVLARMFNPATKIFRATATGINLDFMLPNIVRDMQSAYVNFGVNPLDYAKGLAHYLKKDDVYDAFMRAGGRMSRVSIDDKFLENEVSDALAGRATPMKSKSSVEALAKIGIKATREGFGVVFTDLKSTPKSIVRTLQAIGDASEQPTRIAAFEKIYNKVLKETGDPQLALANGAYAAQEASANFARYGYYGPELNSMYAFLNARIQGVDRIARTIKKDPKGALTRIGIITISPAIATYAWNRMFPSYYDERIVPQSEKDKNFIIMLSNDPIEFLGGAQYMKIPKGDVGKIANVFEEFMRWADQSDPQETAGWQKAMGSVITGFSPVDVNFSLGLPGAVGNIILPTATKPIAEAMSNKSFFTGYDIVPEYKKNYPVEQQTNSITSPTYIWLAERVNATLPEGMKIAPATLQHIVEGYTTGVGKQVSSLFDPAFEGMGYPAPDAKGADINRTPVARRFLGGEKRSEEEQASSLESQANGIDYQIKDIKSGIKKGAIPEEKGYQQIEQLQQKQMDLLDKADQLQGGLIPSAEASSGPSLIPSASADVNPADVAALLKQDERKKMQLDRWALNPTQAKAQQLGLDYDEAKMWLLAKLPDQIESEYIAKDIYAQEGSKDQDAQALKYIEAGRLTNEKVNKALEKGVIEVPQAEHLKALIKQYKISKGLLKGPKAKKIKLASLPKASSARAVSIKLPSLKAPSTGRLKGLSSGSLKNVKSGSGVKIQAPRLDLSEYKPLKVKQVKQVGRVAVR